MSAHIELTVRPYQIAPLSLLLGVKKPVQTGERESSGDIKIPEAPDGPHVSSGPYFFIVFLHQISYTNDVETSFK